MTILLCGKDPRGPFDFDVGRIRASQLIICVQDFPLICNVMVSSYWLTCAEAAASSMSLAIMRYCYQFGIGSRLLRGVIVSGIQNSIPPPLHPSTIVSYENEKLWKRLNVADDGHAYLILLDKDGRIRWIISTALSSAAYKDLKSKIQESAQGL